MSILEIKSHTTLFSTISTLHVKFKKRIILLHMSLFFLWLGWGGGGFHIRFKKNAVWILGVYLPVGAHSPRLPLTWHQLMSPDR